MTVPMKNTPRNIDMNAVHPLNSPLRVVAEIVSLAAVIVSLVGVANASHAASFTGTVSLPDGKPAYGAMLTVFDATKEKRETVVWMP